MTEGVHPKIAVIIPTYNRWPHVCDAIESVLNQSYPAVGGKFVRAQYMVS